jgi:uncharacterized repeat protein (TIGR01451 family)
LSAAKNTLSAISVMALCVLALPAAAQQTCNAATEGYYMDWNQQNYTRGSRSFSTSVRRDGTVSGDPDAEPVAISLAMSGATNRIVTNYPVNSNFLQGGYGSGASSLSLVVDLNAMNENLRTTVNFDRDVEDLRFEIFDIDYLAATNGTGGFRDSVIVTGYNARGGSVLPELTTPYNSGSQGQTAPSTVYIGSPIASNRGAGNPSNGNGASNNDQNLGNMFVRFSDPVVRITIDYSTRDDYFSSTNPQTQGIAIYDFDFCIPRKKPSLTFDKSVRIHSEVPTGCDTIPGTPDPEARAAVPGTCFQYDIDVTNVGEGASNNTTISDVLSADMIFAGAAVSGFDQSDPDFNFITPAPMADCGQSSCLVKVEEAILASGVSGKIIVRTILK